MVLRADNGDYMTLWCVCRCRW